MEVQISKSATERLKRASDVLGIEEKEIVDKAILIYLDDISKYLDYKKEMSMWDKASDEVWRNS